MGYAAQIAPGKKSDKLTAVKHIKMIVIDDLKADTIDKEVSQHISPKTTIVSDASSSYTHFKSLFKEHINMVISPKQIGEVLPWVHIAISNAKRLLLDTFHNVQPEFLQHYLNEFCWKSQWMNPLRNIATWLGRHSRSDVGKSFFIYGYGTARVPIKK